MISPSVNDHLVELLIMADACRRASAAHLTAIIPYFGYARSDKRHGCREPITASMVADLMQAVGIGHINTLDLHTAQIEGFFHIPVVVLHNRRESGTETEVTHVVSNVRDRQCLIVDDTISTGGTGAESIEALRAAGARERVIVAATHGLVISRARDKLTRAGVSVVWITDTVAVPDRDWPQLHIVSVAPLLAAALRRFLVDGSLSGL